MAAEQLLPFDILREIFRHCLISELKPAVRVRAHRDNQRAKFLLRQCKKQAFMLARSSKQCGVEVQSILKSFKLDARHRRSVAEKGISDRLKSEAPTDGSYLKALVTFANGDQLKIPAAWPELAALENDRAFVIVSESTYDRVRRGLRYTERMAHHIEKQRLSSITGRQSPHDELVPTDNPYFFEHRHYGGQAQKESTHDALDQKGHNTKGRMSGMKRKYGRT